MSPSIYLCDIPLIQVILIRVPQVIYPPRLREVVDSLQVHLWHRLLHLPLASPLFHRHLLYLLLLHLLLIILLIYFHLLFFLIISCSYLRLLILQLKVPHLFIQLPLLFLLGFLFLLLSGYHPIVVPIQVPHSALPLIILPPAEHLLIRSQRNSMMLPAINPYHIQSVQS